MYNLIYTLGKKEPILLRDGFRARDGFLGCADKALTEKPSLRKTGSCLRHANCLVQQFISLLIPLYHKFHTIQQTPKIIAHNTTHGIKALRQPLKKFIVIPFKY